MGHVISRDGLKPEDDKVTAIKNTLKLTTRSEVLTLLVFVNYLSKFLVAHPTRITSWARGKSGTSAEESKLENGYLY